MKDKIYEKYGYRVDYFTYKNDSIYFKIADSKYMLKKTNLSQDELNKINMIVNYLENYGIFFHKLILNKDGYIFEFGEYKYVLLKLRITSDRIIALDEIIKLSSISVDFKYSKSIEEKIDFIEKYLANYEKLDLANISYFIGLAENSISLSMVVKNNRNFIGHKRIRYNEKAVDFYNPLDIVLDYQSRDLAEYAKSAFINGKNQVVAIMKILNYEEWIAYFSRLLFPSLYFDNVDQFINLGAMLNKKRIRSVANSFEKCLRETYNVIISNINVPYIDWLSNINNF